MVLYEIQKKRRKKWSVCSIYGFRAEGHVTVLYCTVLHSMHSSEIHLDWVLDLAFRQHSLYCKSRRIVQLWKMRTSEYLTARQRLCFFACLFTFVHSFIQHSLATGNWMCRKIRR